MRTSPLARSGIVVLLSALATFAAGAATAQSADETKLVQAAGVLHEFTTDEEHGIPAELLQRAHGIVVIPNLIRGGFFVGGRRGRGVLTVRTPNGEWSNPAFITLTGGSFGWQFGAEAADVVLVFANERSVRNIANGKFTFGGEATAVAGPMGRRATGAVTGRSEVYVYTLHARGAFAGAAFEGTRLDVDEEGDDLFYGSQAHALEPQSFGTPESARRFIESLGIAAMLPGVPGAPPQARPADAAQGEEAIIYPLGGQQ